MLFAMLANPNFFNLLNKKIDAQKNEQYNKKLTQGSFDCALVTLESKFNSPISILSNFSSGSDKNYGHYAIKGLEKNLNSATLEPDFMVNRFCEAEKTICQGGYFIPLTFETQYFVCSNKFKNILFNPASKEFYYAFCDVS